MNTTAKRQQTLLEYVLLYLVILGSVALVLISEFRAIPWAKAVSQIMMFALFAMIVRRDVKSGAYKNTIGETYAQAKGGRKFTTTLELAAVIAVSIALWKAS